MTQPQPPGTLAYQTQSVPAHPPEWTNVRMYGLRPEAFSAYAHQQIAILSTFKFALLLPLSAVLYWLLHPSPGEALFYAVLYVPTVVALLALRGWRTYAQLRRWWPQYRLYVSDQGLLRTTPRYPDLIILNEHFKRIYETGRGMSVTSTKKPGYIVIPAGLESFVEVRARLAAIKPITSNRATWTRAVLQLSFAGGILLADVAAFLTGLLSRRLPVEWAMLAITTAIGLFLLVRTMRSPNLRLSQKLVGPIHMLLPLALALMMLARHVLRIVY